MTSQPGWDAAYVAGLPPPWDIGRPQPALTRLADQGLLRGRLLDAGCGTGEKESFALVEHALSLGAARKQAGPARVCYVPTAVGDAPAAIDFYEGKFAGRADVTVLRPI